jgi:hypothetical protein
MRTGCAHLAGESRYVVSDVELTHFPEHRVRVSGLGTPGFLIRMVRSLDGQGLSRNAFLLRLALVDVALCVP